MHSFDITIENLSKIEGHADLHVRVLNDKVKDVRLMIAENRRFYEQAVENNEIEMAPQLLSRICGTCSIAHEMCSIKSIEQALNMVPSQQTSTLRELAMYGLMIRDHGLHLGFFSLPDLMGKDSILDFDENNEKEHKLIHDIFDIKQAGNDLSTLVVGRAVHGIFATVGGFTSFPEKEKVSQVVRSLNEVRWKAMNLVDIFSEWDQSLKSESEFASLTNSDFSFLNGDVLVEGRRIVEKDYVNHLNEFVIPYSTSKGYEFEGKVLMVGALARINQNKKSLHSDTRNDIKTSMFPSYNVFHNNLAQAIEIVHSIDSSLEILEGTDFKQEEIVEPDSREGEGVGIIEAPRGLLHHYVKIKNSKVVGSKVIVPTSHDCGEFAESERQKRH